MKWLVTFLIAWTAAAQPVDRLEDVRTADELIALIDEWARGPMPDIQSITFDNGVTSEGGLSLSVVRGGTGYNEAGTAVATNTARYGNSHRIAAAPAAPTTLGGFTSAAYRPLNSGLASDGTTPVLVERKGQATLYVHARTDPETYHAGGSTTGSYATTLGTNGDILNGQTSSNGGTAAIASHEFVPGSAAVWKGYVVVGCDHLYDDGGGFDSVGCALAYTTIDRLASSNPWILLAVTEPVNLGVAAHHQAWSLTKFEISATLCVFLWTDYGTSDREGGNAQASILDISSGSPVWTHIRLADSYRSGTDDDEHFHSAGLIIDGDGDWHFLISVGDGYERNRLIHRRLAAADVAAKNWSAGTTYTHGTYGATGISSSYVIENPHANLGSATAVWGDVAASAGRAYRHNQVINMVQYDADCSALLCGTDETAPGIVKVTWNDTLTCPEWHAPYLPAMSSASGDGVVNFVINGKPGGPFVAKIGADGWDDSGTGGSGEADLEACVIYSPDGDSWTQIIDHQQAAQYAAVLHSGKVYLGCAASGTAQYTTLPSTAARQPLQIASTAANSLASINAATFTGASTGVSITDLQSDLSDLPSAFSGEGPPCHRNNMMLWNVTGDLTANRNHYGQGTIATGLPDSFTDIHVRAWVRAVPFDNSTYANRATPSLWSRLQKTTSPNEASPGGAVLFDADSWTPVDLWFNHNQFSGTISGSWSLRWQLRAVGLSTDTAPGQFVMAVEGVYLDTGKIASHGGVAGSGSAVSEVATVTGITKRSTWSVYAEVEIPHDQWDNRTGGGPPGNAKTAGSSITNTEKPRLFWLDDSAGSDLVAVYARPDTYEVELDANGTTTASTGNDKYWRRGDVFLCVIICDGTDTVMHFEATDGTIKSVTVSNEAMQFDRIVSDDPALWHRFIIRDGVDPDPEGALRAMAANANWGGESAVGRSRDFRARGWGVR